jgi:hypothetical protein
MGKKREKGGKIRVIEEAGSAQLLSQNCENLGVLGRGRESGEMTLKR